MDIPLPLRAGISLGGGFLIYVTWYWFRVGKFCPAMWGGTAPPVIILLGGIGVWRILNLVVGREE